MHGQPAVLFGFRSCLKDDKVRVLILSANVSGASGLIAELIRSDIGVSGFAASGAWLTMPGSSIRTVFELLCSAGLGTVAAGCAVSFGVVYPVAWFVSPGCLSDDSCGGCSWAWT